MLDRSGGQVVYSGSWSNGLYHGDGVSVQRLVVQPEPPADAAAGFSAVVSRGGHGVDDREGDGGGSAVQFEGTFVRGRRHGYGALSSEADGTVYKGNWHHDRPVTGRWRIRYGDETIYSGHARATVDEEEAKRATAAGRGGGGAPPARNCPQYF